MYKKFRGEVTKVSVMVIASILVVLNSPLKVFQKTDLKVKPKKTFTQYVNMMFLLRYLIKESTDVKKVLLIKYHVYKIVENYCFVLKGC